MKAQLKNHQGTTLFQTRANLDAVLEAALRPIQPISLEETLRILRTTHTDLDVLLMHVAIKMHNAAMNYALHSQAQDEELLKILCQLAKALTDAGADPDAAHRQGKSAKEIMFFDTPDEVRGKMLDYMNETTNARPSISHGF